MDNNRLTQLEEYAFTRYRKLAYLYIRKNQLINICPSAFKGTLIQVLDLSQNRLSCIPNMPAIHKSLSVLILSANRLHLCDNGYKYELQFMLLQRISLRNNKLDHLLGMTISWAASNLAVLDLNNNCLKQVPNFLLLLPKLIWFWLEDNKIACTCEINWLKQIETVVLSMIC